MDRREFNRQALAAVGLAAATVIAGTASADPAEAATPRTAKAPTAASAGTSAPAAAPKVRGVRSIVCRLIGHSWKLTPYRGRAYFRCKRCGQLSAKAY